MRQLPHKEYDGYRSPGIRLREPLLKDVAYENTEDETPFITAYHSFDKAHVLMLAENKIIPQDDAKQILSEFRKMDKEGVEKVRSKHGWGLHSGEHFLIRTLGYDVGGRIHLARSSGDLGQVSARIHTRNQILKCIPQMVSSLKTLVDFSEKHKTILIPESTHGLHAQVTTLGAYSLMWAYGLQRDIERFQNSFTNTNLSPAGSAIGTGSPFPVNRKRTAELLGFDGIVESTLDSILGSDDYLLEFISNLGILCSHTGRWAEDLAFFYSDDMLVIDLPDRFCHTSSIMMHKKNPVALEHMRSTTSASIGIVSGAFASAKSKTGPAESGNLTSSPIGLNNIINLVLRDLGWIDSMLPDITIREEYAKEKISSRWSIATEIAAQIVKVKGYPWRIAHQCVGIMVRLAEERGIKSKDTTTELLDEASQEYFGKKIGLSKDEFNFSLDPLNSVLTRIVDGGPNPDHTEKMSNELREKIKTYDIWFEEKIEKIKESDVNLNKDIDKFLKSN